MFGVRRLALAGACVAVVVLSACSSTSVNRAPVEDRGSSAGKSAPVTDPRTQPVKQPSGFENAGKAGYYTVKPGDTLMRIGLETGQGHKDIARWNAMDNPDKIEVGQVLRVVPPVADTVAVAKPVASSSATTTTLPAAGAASAPAKAASTPVAAASAPSTPAPAAAASGEDDLAWIWPGNGPVVAGFDEVKNKGLDIGGAAGDPVLAAGEGKVVYAGAGLRGYGNLIILKHNNTYLTAYAHNQTLLVKEDQTVKKGQKIAEMGSSDADRVKLHFEVRRQGKPVDPAKYLPAR
ncbi:peptidoglycan DD-metalloendopeptidase family protein [Rhodoferax sp. TS-BS-61-7]|uniref:peptidoglycan DD-metalloendopeptidase family protein n=1 Tax=Rhodoferax sp. TS-BS-61-7 TaxID=2094194 RepID=UPI000CF656EB|nr:peptidoglycan DD-metalloendopeptidase family protein [Rhodoferax sp. TS-BS-61-7]PQA78097.1 peptidase [Rhodoferax sp. TS-BS-61-7]